MKNIREKIPAEVIITCLALFSIAIHLLTAGNLEYHRDELLYFSLGQHPAFGYATVPPLIGWMAWLIQNILGYSLFAVRLVPSILSGVMVFLVSEIAKELGGSKYARVLAGIGFIISIFAMRTFGLFQPVHTDVFFWTLSIYLIIRHINTSLGEYLIYLGLVAGLSFLNKYMIGLLFFCLFVVIPFTQYRRVFTEKKFWFGILIGLLIFLPNIIWQIVNGLPVIWHFSELARTQLNNVNRETFLFEQIMMPGASSVLTVAGLFYLFLNKNVRKFRFLGIVTILVIAILLILRGKSYYTMGVFPFLIAAGSVSYASLLKKPWLKVLLPVMLILLTIPMVPIGIPVFKTDGLVTYFRDLDTGRRFEDNSIHSLPQDYADMLGWEELTMITNKAWQMIPDKKAAFIYCENYGQAGAITIIGKKYGLPAAVCFSESFRYWVPNEFNPDITSFIYINDELGEDVKTIFSKITYIGAITNRDAREFGTKVYLCEEPVGSFNKGWRELIQQLNKK